MHQRAAAAKPEALNADKAKEILNNILPVQKKILDCIEKNKQ